MTKQPPDRADQQSDDQQPRQEGDEIGPLTSDDEAALDRAWATITDEDIAASIRWLDEIKR